MKNLVRLFLLFLLFGCRALWATTVYVDSIACAGNYSILNRNCTGADGTSYTSVQTAANATTGGDTIFLRAGTYTGAVDPGSGTTNNYKTFQNYNDEAVTINGRISGTSRSWLQFIGFTSTGYGGGNGGINFNGQPHDMIFNGLTISHNNSGTGLQMTCDVSPCDNFQVSNCLVTTSQQAGVAFGPSGTTGTRYNNITITDNEIGPGGSAGSGEDSIGIISAATVTIARNNLHDWRHEDGIDLKCSSHDVSITDNTISNMQGNGILINPFPVGCPASGGGYNILIKNNRLLLNGLAAGTGSGLSVDGNTAGVGKTFVIDHNLIVQIAGSRAGLNFNTGVGGGTDTIDVFNNTVVGGNLGIRGNGVKNHVWQNNIFSGSTQGIDLIGSLTNSGNTENHNLYFPTGPNLLEWQNGVTYTNLDTYRSATGQGTGSLNQDPLLDQANAYALLSSSPAIDVGVDIGYPFVGLAPDFGWIEYQPATSLPVSGGSTVDGTTFSPQTFTWTGNYLQLASVSAARSDTTDPATPTITGCSGLTFTLIDTVVIGNQHRKIALFRAMGAAGGSCSPTITYGNTVASVLWTFNEIGNVDTSGSDGSGAVVQSVKDSCTSCTGLTVTLASFSNTLNSTYGAFMIGTNQLLIPKPGFTSIGSGTQNNVTMGNLVEYLVTPDTAVSVTAPVTTLIAGIALEIKRPLASLPITYTSTADATSFQPPSAWSWTPNTLQIAAIFSGSTDSTDPNTPTVTGCSGLTFTHMDSIVIGTTNHRKLSLFRALGTSPASCQPTIDYAGQTIGSIAATFLEIPNVATGGTNGSSAVRQVTKTSCSACSSVAVGLAAFLQSANGTFGAFGFGTNQNIIAAPGYNQISNITIDAPNMAELTEYRTDNDENPSASFPASGIGAGIAFEVVRPASIGLINVSAVPVHTTIGDSFTVNWQTVDWSDTIKIELSRDGGTTWTTLFTGLSDTGSQAWTVTGPSSSSCLFRIGGDTNGFSDTSDMFRIGGRYLK